MRALMTALLVAPVLMAAGPMTDEEAAAAFGAREEMTDLELSPSGDKVLFLGPDRDRGTAAVVVPLSTLQPRTALSSSGTPDKLRSCDFVGDARLVCRADIYAEVSGLGLSTNRLVAVDTDGKNAKTLGQSESIYDRGLRQYDGDVLDLIPGDDRSVLIQRSYVPEARAGTNLARKDEGLGVDRVDTVTLRSQRVERPLRNASSFLTDGQGRVRVVELMQTGAAGRLGSRLTYQYHPRGSDGWRDLGSYDMSSREGLLPLAVDDELDAAYVLKPLNGRRALYRVKLDGSMAEELVLANVRVDVDGVVRSGNGRRVIGATFAEDKRRTVYFDPASKALVETLSRALPQLPLIDITGSNEAGDKLIVHAMSDTDPGRYYLYDTAATSLTELGLVRPPLEDVALSKVAPVAYPAADGTAIPGYLTLPPGVASAAGLPGIVLPHGGPGARDEWTFDWLAQFLANRGYAVLQPNYRGSAGYGEGWFQTNGFQSWETAIGDVTAGGRWLVGQGVPADKLAILGWSYGGYAALQSAAVSPDTYTAVVAIAPVTDLQDLKDEARDFTSAALVADFIGSGPHVVAGSPLQQVARITAPVLLVHGDHDLNVNVNHSRRMDAALRKAGRPAEYLEFAGLEHSLEDSAARAQMLLAISRFLDAKLK